MAIMNALCTHQGVQESVRQLALEFLVSITTMRPKMVQKCRDWVSALVNSAIHMMLETEEDIEAWASDERDDCDDGLTPYECAEEAMDRIAQALGPDVLMTHIFSKVGMFVAEDSWKHKLAAIMTLSQVVEVVEEDEHLNQIIKLLIPFTQNPHPRVRFGALHALGQASLDHYPWVQENFYKELMRVFMVSFDDQVPKVAGHAFASFVNFAEELQPEQLQPVMEGVMEKCYANINHTWRPLREYCVTTMAVIAGVVGTSFTPYYAHVMPLMKKLVQASTSEDDKRLRGKGLECMSLLGVAVGKDVFLPDAKECMEAMLTIMHSGEVKDDDPLQEYLPDSIQRICRVLQEDFNPYVGLFLPSLLKTVSQRPTEVSANDEVGDMSLLVLDDGKCVGLKTSLLDNMQRACSMLDCFIEVLGAKLGVDAVLQCFEALLPLVQFKLNDDVKQAAVKCVADLIGAMRAIVDGGGMPAEQFRTAVLQAIDHTLLAVKDEEDPDIKQSLVKGMEKCVDAGGRGVLPVECVKSIIQRCMEGIRTSMLRRQESKNAPTTDEDDEDEAEELRSQEASLRTSFTEVWGALMKNYPEELTTLNVPAELVTYVVPMLSKYIMEEDRLLGLFVLDDLLEYMGPQVVNSWDSFIGTIIEYVPDKSPQIRQAAAYGLQQASKLPAFDQYAQNACVALVQTIEGTDSKQKKYRSATDNCLSALHFLLLQHKAAVGAAAPPAVELLLKRLPLTHDTEEGLKVNSSLMQVVRSEDPLFLGLSNCNVPAIVGIFALVYKQSGITTTELDDTILQLVSSMGEERVKGMAESFNSKQKERLNKMYQDLQRRSG
eukprot:Platyproteum_vivax@DN7658_c0_g1_i8.p1